MSGGEIQRAELFANVDELMAWKKCHSFKQTELLNWQHGVQKSLDDLNDSLRSTIEGCGVLLETDKLLAAKLDNVEERMNVINKRIRRLEEAVARLIPR